jgi:type I restriction enzyme M protein
LPAPEVLIAEIQEEMAAILTQFGDIAAGLGVEPLEPADVAEWRGLRQRGPGGLQAGR